MSNMDFREIINEEDSVVEDSVNTEEGSETNTTTNSAVESDYQETDDNNDYEDICYVCRRPESIAGKMIRIYGGLTVCLDCMQRTMDAMNSTPYMNPNMNNGTPNMGGMPHISMIDMSDFANFFGGMPTGDGMMGGIPKSQRLKKKKKQENFTTPLKSSVKVEIFWVNKQCDL